MSDPFSESVVALFDQWKHQELLQSLEKAYRSLLEKRTSEVIYGDPDKLGIKQRTKANLKLLQQILLHRAERLTAGALTMMVEKNVYAVALVSRGHCETAAMAGYFCNRLESLVEGNIKLDDFALNAGNAIMGVKHSLFEKAQPPLNILTAIEKTDKYLDKHLFKSKKDILTDCYTWLSDFSHPNFLSSATSFSLNKEQQKFILDHDHNLLKRDFELIGYLDISAQMFLYLFDALVERTECECLKD